MVHPCIQITENICICCAMNTFPCINAFDSFQLSILVHFRCESGKVLGYKPNVDKNHRLRWTVDNIGSTFDWKHILTDCHTCCLQTIAAMGTCAYNFHRYGDNSFSLILFLCSLWPVSFFVCVPFHCSCWYNFLAVALTLIFIPHFQSIKVWTKNMTVSLSSTKLLCG